MNVTMQRVPRDDILSLISSHIAPNLDAIGLRRFQRFALVTQKVWICEFKGQFVAMWGVIPPTLLSDSAYLWSYSDQDAFSDDKDKPSLRFIAMQKSREAVAEMLEEWPVIFGHSSVGEDNSIRWLRWLGAEFLEPDGKLIPFIIRRKDG